jgi:uncharacterized protein (PEP-CTERM system associated)
MALTSAARRRRSSFARSSLALAALLPALAGAQEAAGRSAGFVPTLDTAMNYVDVRRFGTAPSQSELTAELRPGFQYRSRSGRVQGTVSYGLTVAHRSRTEPRLDAQHQLSAALTGQLIENLAFVDVSASVGKQAVSAFGQQSVAGQQIDNANQQEVATLSISPSLRGTLADVAAYDLRLTAAGTNTRKSIEGDSTTTGASLSLRSARRGALISWGLTASSSTTDFRATGDATSDKATLSAEINPDVDYSFSLRAGREASNIGVIERQSYDTWGVSARWSPSPRTMADFDTDRRFFGRSHRIGLSHRLPLSSLRYTSVRDITLSADPNGLGQPLTLYDLFFEQFASQEPDPARRQQLVLNFLSGLGLDPTGSVAGGAVNRGPALLERNDIAWSYSARRLTVSAQAFVSRTRQLQQITVLPGETSLRQRGYTGSLGYRLTPTASFSLLGSRLMTKPTATQPGTDLKSLGLTLSDRLSRYVTAALNARYSVFNAPLPYRETSIGASLGLRF